MPGPAFWAAVAVRTKIPVPMTAPIPSMISWIGPSDLCRDFFSAVARIASSDLTRHMDFLRTAMPPAAMTKFGALTVTGLRLERPVKRHGLARPPVAARAGICCPSTRLSPA
jgi:hypothetical protein